MADEPIEPALAPKAEPLTGQALLDALSTSSAAFIEAEKQFIAPAPLEEE